MTHSFPARRSSDLHEVAAVRHRIAGRDADVVRTRRPPLADGRFVGRRSRAPSLDRRQLAVFDDREDRIAAGGERSEEHTSELQSLMRISYAVFCLNKKQ